MRQALRAAHRGVSKAVVVGGGTRAPLTLQPSQPGTFVYTNVTTALNSYKTPGAMVIAGRDNYGDTNFQAVNAAGGYVLIYLDAILENTVGRYHDLLINSSVYGAAIPRWPGFPQASTYGYLLDVRTTSILHSKLEPVLRLILSENPHCAGFFMDDLGSRTNYSGISWTTTFNSTDQTNYRNGVIAIAQTCRNVCDELNKIWIANGSWNGGTVATNGGGYPTVGTHGCSLADGGCFELWKGFDPAFRSAMAGSAQWATASAIVSGDAVHIAIANDAADRADWADDGTIAYISEQTDYSAAVAPWGSFHSTGMEQFVGGGGGGGGTVAFDAVGPSSAGVSSAASTTLSWSHTCTGTNRLLLVEASMSKTSDTGVTLSATYNGVAMTSVGVVHSNGSTSGFVQMFRLINPPTGANTVVVTASGGTPEDLIGGSESFTGVHQTTPLGTPATASGSTGNPTVNVTGTTTGNMVADAVCNGNTLTASTKTQRWLKNVNTGTAAGNAASSTAAAGGTVAMGYTATADWWGILAVEIKAA